jgi:branched-chain amino acid transport system permease protein
LFFSPTETIDLIILGVLTGLLYGVLALGLNIVWGVMNVINIAHGDFVIVGSYASYWLFVLLGINPILSLLFTIPFGFFLGGITYLGLIKRVEDKPELMSLLLTFGLSTMIGGLILYIYTADQRAVPYYLSAFHFASLNIPQSDLIAAIYAVIVALALRVFLFRTFWGKAIRAVIEDRTSSLLVGINPRTVSFLSFAIGISIATSVGSIVMLLSSVSPVTGPNFTLISFVIVVLGGQGSPVGSIAGGVIIGLVDNLALLFNINAALTPAIGFIILVIVLVIRPQGIMGRRR